MNTNFIDRNKLKQRIMADSSDNQANDVSELLIITAMKIIWKNRKRPDSLEIY